MRPITYIRKHVFAVKQKEFAEIAGTTQASVCRWEAGEQFANSDHQDRIRAAAADRGIAWDDRWFFEMPVAEPQADLAVAS